MASLMCETLRRLCLCFYLVLVVKIKIRTTRPDKTDRKSTSDDNRKTPLPSRNYYTPFFLICQYNLIKKRAAFSKKRSSDFSFTLRWLRSWRALAQRDPLRRSPSTPCLASRKRRSFQIVRDNTFQTSHDTKAIPW